MPPAMNAVETTKRYFELSNKSDFEAIAALLNEAISYASQNTGQFAGKAQVLKMQKDFHDSFSTKNWLIKAIDEVKPGVVIVDYDFVGVKKNGEKVSTTGYETVAVTDGEIVSIDIKNKG
jgi:hypothetical protein